MECRQEKHYTPGELEAMKEADQKGDPEPPHGLHPGHPTKQSEAAHSRTSAVEKAENQAPGRLAV